MKEKLKEEKISDALLKVALGYQVAEITEEYAEVDGELKLTKRKKTKKDIPPDLKAVQLLLSAEGDGNYSGWSEEELLAERERLLAELQEKKEKQEKTEKGQGKAKTNAAQEKKIADEQGLQSVGDDVDLAEKTLTKRVVKTKKVAGSVELNVKKPRPKPRKRVVRKTPQDNADAKLKK